jgi:hypothetical protein
MIFDIGLGGGRKVRILVRGFGGMILWDRIMILMGGGVGRYTLAIIGPLVMEREGHTHVHPNQYIPSHPPLSFFVNH